MPRQNQLYTLEQRLARYEWAKRLRAEGLTLEKTAEAMGVSRATVERIIYKGRPLEKPPSKHRSGLY